MGEEYDYNGNGYVQLGVKVSVIKRLVKEELDEVWRIYYRFFLVIFSLLNLVGFYFECVLELFRGR